MTGQPSLHATHELEVVDRVDFPYPHLVTNNLFSAEDASAMLEWLESEAKWWQQHRDFYTHDTCDNLHDCPLLLKDGPLSKSVRREFARVLSERFELDLDDTETTLGAHRMHPGHGVGIHNDDPVLGTESLRLLVTLRRGAFADSDGGHLCLFAEPHMEGVAGIVRPMHNSAIAFPLSQASYHAVSDVTDGVRYSLIFGFWTKSQVATPRKSSKLRRTHGTEDRLAKLVDLAPLIEFLRDVGAAGIEHSGGRLFDHLLGVASILRRWSAPVDVVKAGLFHSVYGTATFRRQLLSEGDRERLRALLGDRAENLVWLFSSVIFSEIYKFAGESTYTARRRDAANPVSLSAEDVRDLNLIAFANVVEQLPDMELSPGEVFEWRQALGRMAEGFPPDAVTELQDIFEPAVEEVE